MYIDTPIGEIRVFTDGRNIVEILMPGWQTDISPTAQEDLAFTGQLEKAFYAYFDASTAKRAKVAYKELVELCIPKDHKFDAPKFHQDVYRALVDEVPTGSTISYGELAALAGNPKAARAVGTAMRKNPLPIIVPCHRVLQSDGGIGGYMGEAENGEKMKRWLLRHEGVNLKNV